MSLRIPFPRRYSLRTLAIGITVLCLCLGVVGFWLQERRVDGRAEKLLRECGADTVWGLEKDVWMEFPDYEFPHLFLWFDDYAPGIIEGRFATCRRRLTERLLGIHFCQEFISEAELDAIAAADNVKYLEFEDSEFDDLDFTRHRFPSKLKWLLLRYEVPGAPDLVVLSGCKDVEWLEIWGCKATDADLDYLIPMSKLRLLELFDNQITDAGLEKLKQLPELKHLNLSDNPGITDAGLRTISELTNLESLSLMRSEVTDEGIQQLSTLKNLKHLDLWWSKVTEEGVERLQRKLPGTTIRLDQPH